MHALLRCIAPPCRIILPLGNDSQEHERPTVAPERAESLLWSDEVGEKIRVCITYVKAHSFFY